MWYLIYVVYVVQDASYIMYTNLLVDMPRFEGSIPMNDYRG